MFMVAFYAPSEENCTDTLTRLGNSRRSDRILTSEFKLLPCWFHDACAALKVDPEIDWFATDDTAQLERFCAWEMSSKAALFDAFRIPGKMILVIFSLLSLCYLGCLPRSTETMPTAFWWFPFGRGRENGDGAGARNLQDSGDGSLLLPGEANPQVQQEARSLTDMLLKDWLAAFPRKLDGLQLRHPRPTTHAARTRCISSASSASSLPANKLPSPAPWTTSSNSLQPTLKWPPSLVL